MAGDRGLTSVEVERRRQVHGSNTLPPPAAEPAWRLLGRQLVRFFGLMLWIAAGLAVVGGMPELGIGIVVVILLNGVFAFVQERRADHAAEELRDLMPRRVTVVRDGANQTVPAADLVPGDLVLLGGGDRISADLACVEAHDLLLDTSALTGESVPEPISPGDVLRAGCFVVQGEGLGEVTATGSATALASIASLTQDRRRADTPLTRELHRLVRLMALIASTTGAGFFAVSLALSRPLSDSFTFAVGIAVALVPEALLPTVTLSLAIGAQRMAEHHALVRRLDSVETLGSTTFICTDKTGTLTQNRMNVVEVWTPVGTAHVAGVGYEPVAVVDADRDGVLPAVRRVAVVAGRCSSGMAVRGDEGWEAIGDPMEAAIDVLTRRVGADIPGDVEVDPTQARRPFDPRSRTSAALTSHRVLVKGAPDDVLRRCPTARDAAWSALEAMTRRGLRVLAVAQGPRPAPGDAGARDDADVPLVLLGLLGLEDPPRPLVHESVAACRRAGVRLMMITGDHPVTARAIAEEVGLRTPDALVLVEADLPDDDAEMGALLDHDGVVVARVSPLGKLRIARALRARGHVVAMTGDGVNDGPALREADIGIAMGASGTDVAREAADLVLLDDDFATIVAAIRHGRAAFTNTRRFLTYHLTSNVPELTPLVVFAVSGGRIPLALGVLQILAIDIGTDTFAATALGSEPPRADVLERPPVRGRLLDRTVAVRAFGILGPTEAAFEMLAFFAVFALAGWSLGDPFPAGQTLAAASGAAFLTVVVAQTANAHACRSTRLTPWRLGWTSNPLLTIAATVDLVVGLLLLVVPALAALLDHRVPPASAWFLAGVAAGVLLVFDALWKRRPFVRSGAWTRRRPRHLARGRVEGPFSGGGGRG